MQIVCKSCNQLKDSDDFYKRRKDGSIKYPCKDCAKKYNRDRYNRPGMKDRIRDLANKARLKDPNIINKTRDRSAKWYTSIHGRTKTLLAGAQRRASKRGEVCIVSYDHIKRLMEIGTCPITGIKFEFIYRHRENKKDGMHPFAPSIDRIDCEKPYNDENTRLVIWQYNMMKGKMSDKDLYKICLAIVNKHDNCV